MTDSAEIAKKSDKRARLQALWSKYEDIAMHFNDLLMRLRLQSIAGIAALSTIVGIFAKEGAEDKSINWLMITAIFVAMALFWIAIWCLDFLYYNRLLLGAVSALVEVEQQSKSSILINSGINLSTVIEKEFQSPLFTSKTWHFRGVLCFYALVFLTIILGASFCLAMYLNGTPGPSEGRTFISPFLAAS